jgi:uncharacterized damage-inducible protein DinB
MGVRETIEPGFRTIWTAVQQNVELMPEGRLDDRPEGLETRSFREIALHIANASVMFSDNIGKSVWERVTAFPPDNFRSRAQVLDAVRQGGERYLAGLARLTDQEAAKIVETPWGAKLPQGAVVGFAVPHTFYHNGQLSIYLRIAGIKPVFAAR